MNRDQSPWAFLYQYVYVIRSGGIIALLLLVLAGISIWMGKYERTSSSAKTEEKSPEAAAFEARSRAIAVSADGQYLNVVHGNATWCRRDAHTGQELWSRPLPANHFLRPELSRHSDLLIGLNSRGRFEAIQDLKSLGEVELPEQQAGEYLVGCSLSPAAPLVAVASNQGSIWLVTVTESQAVVTERHELDVEIEFLEFSPEGDRIALVDRSRRILVWDVVRKTIDIPVETFSVDCRFVSWSGDGRRLVSYGTENQMRVWDLHASEPVREMETDSQSVTVARLTHNGRLAIAGDDQEIALWDVERGENVTLLQGHAGKITDLRLCDDDRTLFSCDSVGGLRRWSITDLRLVWSVP